MKKSVTLTKKKTLVWPLIRLTLLFIISQCVILSLNFGSILGATPVNKFIFGQVIHSPTVLLGIAKFVGAQLLVHFAYVLLVILVARLIKSLFHLTQATYIALGMLIWFDGIIAIFLANQLYYPHSAFAFLYNIADKMYPALEPYITPHSLHLTFFITCGLAAIAALLALFGFLSVMLKNAKISLSIVLLGVLSAAGYFYWKHYYVPKANPTPVPATTSLNKPNIVLVSIDYFRPGDTTYFGNKTEMTPNVDAMLKQSTVFEHTVTVIARTFPSLMSVESGSYPIKNGARFNLIDPTEVHKQLTLAHILQDQGYYTMMATDGSHFFYMTPDYGYNQIVAPPPGLNEFLLSSINDFPLTNLLINTPIGKCLFPYNYMNRNASFTYEPKTFNKELNNALANRPKQQPLYIHIHLTLGAWPYSWSAPTPRIPTGLTKTEQIHYRFNLGVKAVDKQFGQVMHLLQKQGLLDNAMLVVFSDHGQAFGEPGDRITQKPYLVGKASPADIHRFTELNTAIGHGTDILSMKQYHPLLAFKLYGPLKNQIGARPVVTSLIDIAPTVLDFLHVSDNGMQGISLMPEITAFPQTGLGDTPIFMETEFTLPSILTADPSIGKVLNEGLSYYDLNPKTGILQVKPMIGKLIIKGKQRAVLQGKWLLAFYPNSTGPGTLVLVNLATKQWTVDLSDAFAQSAPLPQMWKELKDFYGNEIDMPALPAAAHNLVTPPDVVLGHDAATATAETSSASAAVSSPTSSATQKTNAIAGNTQPKVTTK